MADIEIDRYTVMSTWEYKAGELLCEAESKFSGLIFHGIFSIICVIALFIDHATPFLDNWELWGLIIGYLFIGNAVFLYETFRFKKKVHDVQWSYEYPSITGELMRSNPELYMELYVKAPLGWDAVKKRYKEDLSKEKAKKP